MYYLIVNPRLMVRFREMLFFAEHIYEGYNASPDYRKVCDDCTAHLFRSAFYDISLFLFSFLLVVLIRFYLLIFKNEFQLFYPWILPYVDPETVVGFYINFGHQMAFGLCAFCALLGIEVTITTLKNSVYLQSMSISYSIDQFDKCLSAEKDFKIKMKAQLRNILAQIGDFERFTLEWTDLYYWKFLTQPFLLALCVSGAMFIYILVIYLTIFSLFVSI